MTEIDPQVWQKRFDRERQARKSAEKLLEDKSMELWEINQNLEQLVEHRTHELHEALEQAQGAIKAKDAFLSSMSHELRTPLNAIIGFSQILIARPETSVASKAFIEKIQIAGKTLLSLVNTILDFSKIESGKMDFSPIEFSIEQLFNNVSVIMEALLIKKSLTLIFDRGMIENMVADEQLMKQVLVNLISNAIKFSPQGGEIRVRCESLEESVCISVSDQGAGIEEERKEKLFQPFSQLSNAKTIDEAGTGLGLMIIKNIATLHEGEVGVNNVVPHGAQFWISIPQPKER